MSAIELHGASKRFGDTEVLQGVDLAVAHGSITAVLGASGSGKTTLLRLIAGFERLDSGSISIGGQVVDDGRRTVAAQHRGVGYVAQEGALFPHLTVAGNIGFGLSRRERSGADHLLELTGLQDLRRRYPHELSGGQQQRVALARALAIGPRVVLLDEPFSALDASLRGDLRRDVARILGETRTTAVLVTHDQDEALALAGKVALLADGRVRAVAEPRELYRDPPDVGTAEAIGEANIVTAHVTAGVAHCALGAIPIRTAGSEAPSDGPARVLLRPEQLTVLLHATDEGVTAGVVEVHYHGHDALARLRLATAGDPDLTLLARIPGRLDLEPGRQVWIEVLGSARAWPAAGDRTADRLRVS
jgi:iron(III) transport system ATP-binding protein